MKNWAIIIITILTKVIGFIKPKSLLWFLVSIVLVLLSFWDNILEIFNSIVELF